MIERLNQIQIKNRMKLTLAEGGEGDKEQSLNSLDGQIEANQIDRSLWRWNHINREDWHNRFGDGALSIASTGVSCLMTSAALCEEPSWPQAAVTLTNSKARTFGEHLVFIFILLLRGFDSFGWKKNLASLCVDQMIIWTPRVCWMRAVRWDVARTPGLHMKPAVAISPASSAWWQFDFRWWRRKYSDQLHLVALMMTCFDCATHALTHSPIY